MRMLIWTPMNAAELQKGMHTRNVGPAALVPVQSGTVLLPSPAATLAEVMLMTSRLRYVSGGGVAILWDAEATLILAFTAPRGRIGRSWSWGTKAALQRLTSALKQSGPFGVAFDRVLGAPNFHWHRPASRAKALECLMTMVPGADRAAVDARLADHEVGPGSVPALCEVLGLPDVAQVAGLVELGRADAWLQPLAPPRVPQWPVAILMVFIVLWLAAGYMFTFPLFVFPAVLLVLAIALPVTVNLMTPSLVRRKPINTVLPVIPVTQGAVPTD